MTAILIEIAKFVGALLICFGGILALFSPVFAGQYAASRLPKRVTLAIIALLLVPMFFGVGDLVKTLSGHPTPGYWGMVIFFLPLYTIAGLAMGQGKKNLQAIHEKSLVNWRQQLENDRKLDGASLRLALDYREIGSLLTKLGRREEACEEYRQGMVIMELSLKGHPAIREYYSGYLGLLSGKKDAEEKLRIKAKIEALPQL